MRIKCKGFDVTIERVAGRTKFVCHSISKEQLRVLEYNANGHLISSRSSMELGEEATYLLGSQDHTNFNKIIFNTEEFEVYEIRLRSLIACAKYLGGYNKVDPRPEWF
jgi:hypothetical protein